jgi:hypothetical protein
MHRGAAPALRDQANVNTAAQARSSWSVRGAQILLTPRAVMTLAIRKIHLAPALVPATSASLTKFLWTTIGCAVIETLRNGPVFRPSSPVLDRPRM